MILWIFFLLLTLFSALIVFEWLTQFSTQTTDRATQNNINNLAKTVAALLQSEDTAQAATLPLYLSPDYILVGFGKNQKIVSQTCTGEPISKPNHPACTESCICGYRNGAGDDFGEDTTLEFCASVPVDYILSIDYRNSQSPRSLSTPYYKFHRRYLDAQDPNAWKIFDGFAGEGFSTTQYGKPYIPASLLALPPNYAYSYFTLYGQCPEIVHSETHQDGNLVQGSAVPFGIQYLTLEVARAEEFTYLIILYKNTLGYAERQKALEQLNQAKEVEPRV